MNTTQQPTTFTPETHFAWGAQDARHDHKRGIDRRNGNREGLTPGNLPTWDEAYCQGYAWSQDNPTQADEWNAEGEGLRGLKARGIIQD